MTTLVWGADVYRSTDAQGNVSYSDRPQDDNAQYVHVATPGVAGVALQLPQRASVSPPATPAPEGDAAPQRERREPTAAERAEDRLKNCGIARQRLQSYSESHRLYRTSPDGEREYLDDSEIDAARARAAADVETWCD